MLFMEYVDQTNKLTKQELDQIEKYLDDMFSGLKVDVEFTKHFFDRLHDERNGKEISKQDLIDLFRKEYVRYGKEIANMKVDSEAVLSDLSTNVNSPVVLKWNSKKKMLELTVKTVMRKKGFKPNNSNDKHFKVS